MKKSNEKLEKILEEVLKLLEQGKSVPEILSLFPESEKELIEVFKLIDILSSGKINPKKEILERIISRIEAEKSVTEKEHHRYINIEEALKGRSSLINFTKDRFNMNGKWKIFIPVGVLAIIVAVLIVVNKLPGNLFKISNLPLSQESAKETAKKELVTPGEEVAKESSKVSQENLPSATGKVDDAISSVLNDAFAEFLQTENDMQEGADLLNLDSQALNDFLQAYNENEF
jgi:uncharacterized integral membrane protein